MPCRFMQTDWFRLTPYSCVSVLDLVYLWWCWWWWWIDDTVLHKIFAFEKRQTKTTRVVRFLIPHFIPLQVHFNWMKIGSSVLTFGLLWVENWEKTEIQLVPNPYLVWLCKRWLVRCLLVSSPTVDCQSIETCPYTQDTLVCFLGDRHLVHCLTCSLRLHKYEISTFRFRKRMVRHYKMVEHLNVIVNFFCVCDAIVGIIRMSATGIEGRLFNGNELLHFMFTKMHEISK